MSVILPLGEFTPDLPDFNNPGMTTARNCVPVSPASYGPLPSLAPFAGNKSINPIPPLPDTPYGLVSFRDRDGTEHIITGTRDKLYRFQTGDSQFKDVSGVTTHYTVTQADITGAGTGYTAGDLVTLTASTTGSTAQIQINTVEADLFHAGSTDLTTAGTGYTAGDVLTITGGTATTAAQITVQTVDGSGVILESVYTENGDYSVTPANPAAVTGGTGTGATFTITWDKDPISGSITAATIFSGGDYTYTPTNPVAVIGGTGSGATFSLTMTSTSTDAKVYHATPYDPWTFVIFQNSVIATTGNDEPQYMNLDTDDQFSDLNTSKAVFAKYACVCRNFLVMAYVTELTDGTTFPNRLHWSAIGDPGTWPDLGSIESAQKQSDAQELRADLGQITGIASNLLSADLAVLFDQGCYVGRYVGSPVLFNFDVAQNAVGCQVPRSVVINRGQMFYLGNDGYVVFDGTSTVGIGANKVDHWFFNDPEDGVDLGYLYLTQGSADPTGRLIFWAYCGPDSNGIPNRLLIFNWSLNRWSYARIDIAWLGRGLTTGWSIDELDQFGTVDTIMPSFDDPYWAGGKPYLLAFDEHNRVMAFTGPNLEATIVTQEGQPTPAKRSRVTSVRPLVDGGSPSVSVGSRNRLEDEVVFADEVPLNVYGACSVRVDARYFRGQIVIPAGAAWKHAQGIEVDFAPSTYR